MKKACRLGMAFFLALGLMVGLTVVATAADMTGHWELTVEAPSGTGNPTFDLKQDGEKLSGTYKGRFGESPVQGTVKGEDFELSFETNGMVITYKGKSDGSKMSGVAEFGMYGEGTFTGKKK